MNRTRSFVGLVLLSLLIGGAAPAFQKDSGNGSPPQVAGIRAADPGTADPGTPASRPTENVRDEASSAGFEPLSGGPAGVVLVAAAILAAAALLLAVLIPW